MSALLTALAVDTDAQVGLGDPYRCRTLLEQLDFGDARAGLAALRRR